MIKTAKKCSFFNCDKPVVAKDFCNTHYKRFIRHGHVLDTRPADWGSREKHPLYGIWRDTLIRRYEKEINEEWKNDFWKFVADIGERPDDKSQLRKIDSSKPFEKGNLYWKSPLVTDINIRTHHAEYMREWQRKRRAENPFHQLSNSLKRYYGITLDDYLKMHDAQNGLCAICDKEKKSVDPKTKKVRRLAVDHCHESGEIRALLCSKCNAGLGHFMDSINNMQKAIEYLKTHT